MHRIIIVLLLLGIHLHAGKIYGTQIRENIEQVDELYNFWGEPKDVAVSGDVAYVATELSGLQIVDISDRENPEQIGYFDVTDYCSQVIIEGNLAYIREPLFGFHIINITNPEQPFLVSSYEQTTRNIAVSNQHVYLSQGDTGFKIINATNPYQPVEVERINPRLHVNDVFVLDDLAYVVGDSTLCIYDVSNPRNTREIGRTRLSSSSGCVTVSGDYAYVTLCFQYM